MRAMAHDSHVQQVWKGSHERVNARIFTFPVQDAAAHIIAVAAIEQRPETILCVKKAVQFWQVGPVWLVVDFFSLL